jgi:hypothetical protein
MTQMLNNLVACNENCCDCAEGCKFFIRTHDFCMVFYIFNNLADCFNPLCLCAFEVVGVRTLCITECFIIHLIIIIIMDIEVTQNSTQSSRSYDFRNKGLL